MKISHLICLGSLWLVGCQLPTPSARVATELHFFDVSNFFHQQIQLLTTRHNENKDWLIHKTIQHNNKSESHEIRINNWYKELALFQQTNINKPTLIDAYRIDTLRDNATHAILRISYIALKNDITTQAIDIQYKNQQPYSISIINKSQNTVYTSEQYLEYIADKGYKVVQKQRIWGWRSDEFTIEATF